MFLGRSNSAKYSSWTGFPSLCYDSPLRASKGLPLSKPRCQALRLTLNELLLAALLVQRRHLSRRVQTQTMPERDQAGDGMEWPSTPNRPRSRDTTIMSEMIFYLNGRDYHSWNHSSSDYTVDNSANVISLLSCGSHAVMMHWRPNSQQGAHLILDNIWQLRGTRTVCAHPKVKSTESGEFDQAIVHWQRKLGNSAMILIDFHMTETEDCYKLKGYVYLWHEWARQYLGTLKPGA